MLQTRLRARPVSFYTCPYWKMFFMLNDNWDKWQITSDPPPRMVILGGSTFWILKWCNSRIFLKIFLVRKWGQRIFSAEIFGRSAEFSAKNLHLKFQNLRKFWKKQKKNSIFFFECGSRCHMMSQKKKKIFSRLFSPYKAPG